MELILLENILNLGNIGDKVTVKNGYGRNFLLKKGKALRFNKDNQVFVDNKKAELNIPDTNDSNIESQKNNLYGIKLYELVMNNYITDESLFINFVN